MSVHEDISIIIIVAKLCAVMNCNYTMYCTSVHIVLGKIWKH